jgi:hypothetical protein
MRLCAPIILGCTRAVCAEPAKPSRLGDTEQIIGLLVLAVVVVPLPLPLCDTRLDGSPAVNVVHGYPLISRAMYGRIGLASVRSVTQLAIDLGRRREAGGGRQCGSPDLLTRRLPEKSPLTASFNKCLSLLFPGVDNAAALDAETWANAMHRAYGGTAKRSES